MEWAARATIPTSCCAPHCLQPFAALSLHPLSTAQAKSDAGVWTHLRRLALPKQHVGVELRRTRRRLVLPLRQPQQLILLARRRPLPSAARPYAAIPRTAGDAMRAWKFQKCAPTKLAYPPSCSVKTSCVAMLATRDGVLPPSEP
jgi:hypothetical protein